MAKLDLEPKTLDDKIIKDGLCAISALAGDPYSSEHYFVVGGIAAQGYLPTRCRRGTRDIDLAVLIRLNKRDFKIFSREAKTCLDDMGYETSYRKSQSSFCLDFVDEQIVLSRDAQCDFNRSISRNLDRDNNRYQQ